MAVREPIYVALWNLFLNHPNLQGQFVTTSRYKQHFDVIASEQMPALFLNQTGEQWTKPGKGIPAKRQTLFFSATMLVPVCVAWANYRVDRQTHG